MEREPVEVEVGEDLILAWDGRVLELFGGSGSGATRWHARRVTVGLDGPDRKGRYSLLLRGPNDGGSLITVQPQDVPAVQELVAAVLAAAGGWPAS